MESDARITGETLKMDKTSKKFTIPHDKVWLRPDMAYFEYQKQATGIDHDEIEYNGKYKRIREIRDLAIFGLAFYTMQEHRCFVQMNNIDDSPDAFLMRPVSDETQEIAPIEMTFYGRNRLGLPEKSLVEKLSEQGGKFQLPEKYWIIIHIGKDLEVDHQAVTDSLLATGRDIKAFSVQEVSNHPDTIARVVFYSPKLEAYDINVSAISNKLAQTNIPGTVTVNRGRKPKDS